ncbi:hypothetical protein MOQ72_12725 [Saccharopolyspora sp. K220]|uniref:hypothetical protein n=1 Tax=Saccharopolyspora soli TaxID=2926618 RepID=UPI001F594757|nr:hypothetical protein [Saccharopolyspora soli]MCI2418296.1 hypothetical protein [Saccharopolyspora soli]
MTAAALGRPRRPAFSGVGRNFTMHHGTVGHRNPRTAGRFGWHLPHRERKVEP